MRGVIVAILALLAVNVAVEVVLLARSAGDPVAVARPVQHIAVPGGVRGDGGLAVGPDGRFYVAESKPARLRVFDPGGRLLATWDGRDGTVRFKAPTAVAVLPDGEVAVLDAGASAIVRCAPDGRRWLSMPIAGIAGAQGLTPRRGGGYYVVATGAPRVLRVDAGGHVQARWGRWGPEAGEFSDPWGVAEGPDGTVYVADRGNGRLEAFDSAGRFVRAWDTDGPPGALAFAGGVLYAALPLGGGLEALQPGAGAVLRLVSGGRRDLVLDAPVGLAAAPGGGLWVAGATGLARVRVDLGT